jgi:hypothetical protein
MNSLIFNISKNTSQSKMESKENNEIVNAGQKSLILYEIPFFYQYQAAGTPSR